jgi:hypothetical protein
MAMVASAAMLVAATVVVFLIFDSHSHSNSDTIRPFLITMGPAWLLFVLAWRLTAKPRK